MMTLELKSFFGGCAIALMLFFYEGIATVNGTVSADGILKEGKGVAFTETVSPGVYTVIFSHRRFNAHYSVAFEGGDLSVISKSSRGFYCRTPDESDALFRFKIE